jgi:hypothetical protein
VIELLTRGASKVGPHELLLLDEKQSPALAQGAAAHASR